ncbi:helix-turn-helix domain-containing protein [Xanthobacter pseudotagetidis]|uniref:helix-turn-helix domain-containing protein n=1 Tax=Xanthobacter pseudotagetidis TaxID=3119911 RepID=UPI00372A1EA9
MLGSAHRIFGSADEYTQTIRAAHVQAAVLEPGQFAGELARIDFRQLWLQRGSESLARSLHIYVPKQRSPIFFLTDSHQAATRVNGIEFKPGDLLFWGAESEQYQRTDASIRWGTMSLEPERLARAASAILGYEISAPADTRVLRPNGIAMSRLATLHQMVGALARSSPNIFAHAQTSNAIEHTLVHAMLLAIDSGQEKELGAGLRNRRAILRDLEDLIARNIARPLYLMDLCVALGTSERTLRRAFQEQLGISPNRYLWLRRMYLANRALQLSAPVQASVTSIAMEHGFWELGRFATAYRQLFGETPSITLRKPPDFVPRTLPPSYRGLAHLDP